MGFYQITAVAFQFAITLVIIPGFAGAVTIQQLAGGAQMIGEITQRPRVTIQLQGLIHARAMQELARAITEHRRFIS